MTSLSPSDALKRAIERTQLVQAAAKTASVELSDAAFAAEEEPEERTGVEISERPALGG